MDIKAIVYTSNTGCTEKYAHMIGKKTGLAVYPLGEAEKKLPRGENIIYLGWLMAGRIKGYRKAAKRFAVCAVCGVGMAKSGGQLADVRKANALADSLPAFTLQGGFDMQRLRGIYRFAMMSMAKTLGKQISKKQDRTPEEEEMLQLLLHGGDLVKEENTDELMAWYEKTK